LQTENTPFECHRPGGRVKISLRATGPRERPNERQSVKGCVVRTRRADLTLTPRVIPVSRLRAVKAIRSGALPRRFRSRLFLCQGSFQASFVPRDIGQRIIGLAVGMAIISMLVLAKSTPLRYVLFLVAFLAAVGLCYRAKARPIVALMIPLPLLFNDLRFFIPPDESFWSYIRYEMVGTTFPVIGAAGLGCLVSSVLPKWRAAWRISPG
jgi:hypothetical protein